MGKRMVGDAGGGGDGEGGGERKLIPVPPLYRKDGTIDLEYFRAQIANLNAKFIASFEPGSKIPAGYEQGLKGVMLEAKFVGVTETQIADRRTPEQIAAETSDKLLNAPTETWALLDAELDAVEANIRAAVAGCQAVMERRQEATEEEADRIRRGKVWLSRLERVRRLREMARNPVPKVTWTGRPPPASERFVWEASHVLRWAVYTGRSDLSDVGMTTTVLDMASVHCEIAFAIWEAKNKVKFYAKGDPLHPCGGPKYGVTLCQGVVILTPPRHGKTTVGRAQVALWIFQNPRLQGLMNHAVDLEACKNLGYVKACFQPDNSTGRRCLSLFPGLKLTKKENDTSRMRVDLPDKSRQYTLFATGVDGSVTGSSANFQWWDDPVDQKERDEETKRKKKVSRLAGTWLTRMQGSDPFLLLTATAWHESDAVCDIIKRAAAGLVPYLVSVQAVGGPRTTPPFKPIWPEKYGEAKLRQLYRVVNDPALWAAAYMANPIADELRPVRRLAYYLAGHGECGRPAPEHQELVAEHLRFLEGAETHLSLDPAATNRPSSDKAGLVWLAVGDVMRSRMVDGEEIIDRWTRIRVLDARQFHATQSEAVEHVAAYAVGHKTDYIHVETVAGFAATAEMFRNAYGLDVITHNPGGKDKIQRLKNVAALLEDANREQSLPGAVVEFPAVLDEAGRVVPDPRLKWLETQILNAGVTAEDHCLDALTQVLKYLSLSVSPAAGLASTIIGRAVAESPNRRRLREDYLADDRAPGGTAEEEDLRWQCN